MGIWAAAITALVAAVAGPLYQVKAKQPWPLATKIGVALGGAFLGTFGGALMTTHDFFSAYRWVQLLSIVALATAFCVLFQRAMFGILNTEKKKSGACR